MGRNCSHAQRLWRAGLGMEVVVGKCFARSEYIQSLSGLRTAIPDIVRVQEGLYEGGATQLLTGSRVFRGKCYDRC
jgi:hypothetical protein